MSNPLNPIDNFFFSIFWLAIIFIIFACLRSLADAD